MASEQKRDKSENDAALGARIHRIGVIVLAAGLLSAAVIYMTAGPDNKNGAIGYETVGGQSYAVAPADSRQYEANVERIGGKSAVLAVGFSDWFGGLWRGRTLAYTVAFLSVGGCVACLFLEHLLSLPRRPDDRDHR